MWLAGTGLAPAPPPRKSVADIVRAWESLRGFGFSTSNYPQFLAMGVRLGDLTVLKDDEKTQPVSHINAGASDRNRIRSSELNDALATAFATPGVDVFADRHVVV